MSRQLDLFGAGDGGRRLRTVGPAEVPEPVRRLAERLPAGVHLGTSSWSFPGWAGIVYDRSATPSELARHGLAAYAAHPLLRSVGIDRTYHAPIPARVFADYAAAVPDGFRFLVKAHARVTDSHLRPPGDPGGRGARNPAFLDDAYAAREIVEPFARGLGGRAGPLVFQFAPLGAEHTFEPERFAERLHAFLSRLPRGPLYAVELRNRELLTSAYAAALADTGSIHCFNVHPRMPGLDAQRRVVADRAGPAVAVRWMLHGTFRYEQARERYAPFRRLVDEDPAGRDAVARLCLQAAAAGRPAFVIANNKAEGSAPLTLVELARRLADGAAGRGGATPSAA